MDLASLVGGAVSGGAAPGMGGFGDIGAAVGNLLGGGGNQKAYYEGANQGLSLQMKQLQARKLRDEAVARDNTFSKLQAAFPEMPPEMMELAANTMVGGMGSDFSSTMTGMGKVQENQLQMQAAGEADPVIANRILSALNGKPNDLTQIGGNTAYNPTVAPTDQSLVMTPDAVADNVRDALVDRSQIGRNEAAAYRSLNPRAGVTSSGRPVRDPIADYAAKQSIDAINRDYKIRMQSAKTPAQKAALETERATAVDKIVQQSVGGATTGSISLAGSDAAAIADDIERDSGTKLSQAQREDIARQLMMTGKFSIPDPYQAGQDGTAPPQVMDPGTGKPVAGGKADKPGNVATDVNEALLGPRIDFVNGGYAGQTKPVASRGDSIPDAAASRLKEGVETVFANGQTWTKRSGIPVRVK